MYQKTLIQAILQRICYLSFALTVSKSVINLWLEKKYICQGGFNLTFSNVDCLWKQCCCEIVGDCQGAGAAGQGLHSELWSHPLSLMSTVHVCLQSLFIGKYLSTAPLSRGYIQWSHPLSLEDHNLIESSCFGWKTFKFQFSQDHQNGKSFTRSIISEQAYAL